MNMFTTSLSSLVMRIKHLLKKLNWFFLLQHHNKLRSEAEARGEKYKIDKLRRNIEMDEYDLIHWRRSFEEREALLRDISWYSHQCFFSPFANPFILLWISCSVTDLC